MIIGMDKNQTFVHHYQNIIIVKLLQKIIGDIYLGKEKTIATGVLFIMENTRIYC